LSRGDSASIEIPKYQYVAFDFPIFRRLVRRGREIGLGDSVVAPRRVIALPTDEEQRQRFAGNFSLANRAHEPCRTGTDYSGLFGGAFGVRGGADDWVTQQAVTRCLKRAAELGVIEALDDRPRAGRNPVITAEAKTWLVALACQKPKELGYPHEFWTTRLLAAHARQHAPSAGHPSLGKLAQGTVCKILAEREVKPLKVRYYLEQRDPEFEPKMAEILCVYRQVAMLREQAGSGESQGRDGGDTGASLSSPTTRNQGSS
jgi:hypothetical protein